MDTDDNDYNVTFYLPCGLIDDDVQLPRRRHRRLTSSNGADSEPSSSAAQVRLFSSYCSTQAHQTPHTPHRKEITTHRTGKVVFQRQLTIPRLSDFLSASSSSSAMLIDDPTVSSTPSASSSASAMQIPAPSDTRD